MARRPVAAILAGLVGVVTALVLGMPAPAWAHAELTSSDPADGAVLDVAPLALSFTFGEQLLRQGNAVTATRLDDGLRVPLGALIVSGDTVSAGWPAEHAGGSYRAAYRVVSADGHPITGTITFRIGGPDSPAPSTPPASTLAPSPSGASPGSTTPPGPTGSGADGWPLWLGLGLVLVVGVAAGAQFLRRRDR